MEEENVLLQDVYSKGLQTSALAPTRSDYFALEPIEGSFLNFGTDNSQP
jgi:hypothetical protein